MNVFPLKQPIYMCSDPLPVFEVPELCLQVRDIAPHPVHGYHRSE